MHIDTGIVADEIEIDFDSMFPLLEICLLAFGVGEWLMVALDTISFN
jgi:hypothetical protein